ncbi:cation diffusion facilitator family transporter [Streptomyces sp. 8L]|uniref:cation diffusion facilitator family transporter n=1 Tax=Streptomyces sp. 8L TaxID=2877242 RepID=UPI001CD65290|nr:cation diffusion facilitator family transporter [Streptomyces sp. 8L]MCA1220893.1 cation transporter [Streptomyces sp. 8L]
MNRERPQTTDTAYGRTDRAEHPAGERAGPSGAGETASAAPAEETTETAQAAQTTEAAQTAQTTEATEAAPAAQDADADETTEATGEKADGKTRVTVLVALAANLVIAVAKAAGGLLSGSPALLSEAAHSVADSLNEVFLLASLKRSRKKPDSDHPFGYGKERYFWALLAAVGIFVMGGCFSVFQGAEALRSGENEKTTGYIVGLIVLAVALVAEGTSLTRAVLQLRASKKGAAQDPTLRTVLAEDSTAVLGVVLAMLGMALHWITGNIVWEASASFAIGALLVYIAYRLGSDARGQLIGEAVDKETRDRIRGLLTEQPEIDNVAALLTMKLGLDTALVAARVDLVPGMDSERVELVCERIKREVTETWPEADQVFLDITEAPAAGRSRVEQRR